MIYQRSQDIERRLETVLELIHTGRYSTPTLAQQVGVSIPTVSRCVTALRERGHDIRAQKHVDGWRYILVRKSSMAKSPQKSEFVEVNG